MSNILDSILVKPLPKKYEKSKNIFSFNEINDEEELLDSKIIDKTDSFSKKDYNDFISKLSSKNKFIDNTKEIKTIKETIEENISEGYKEFKNNNTIIEISLKDPLEKITILNNIDTEKEKEIKTSVKKPISRITEKPKTLKPKDYSIDNEFIIDEEMIIGDSPIKNRIINITKPMVKTDSYYLENREIYIKYIQEL
mgnify:FL=1